jgi:ATP-binding cassette, subfamily B, bacterial
VADGTGWLVRLGHFLRPHRRDLTVSLTCAVGGGLCQVAVPLVYRTIVDGAVVGQGLAVTRWIGLLIGLGLAIFGFAHLRRYVGGRVALNVQYDLRTALHDHLIGLDQAVLSTLPTGQLVGRANSDTTLVQGLLAFFPIVSSNVLVIVLSLAVMIWLSPPLALVGLIVVPALLAVSYRMRWKVFPATWSAQQTEGELVQVVDENIQGVRVVAAFAQEDKELARLVAASMDLYGQRMRAVRLEARYQPLLEAIPVFGQVAVVAVGGLLALGGHITLGTFLAFSAYVAQLVAPAQRIAGILTIAQQARGGVERIGAVLDLVPAVDDAPGASDLGPVAGEIRFEHVDAAYGEHPVLTDVNLTLMPGERIAIVGTSGAGKSTLVSLLSRVLDVTSGRVLVDGRDVRDVTRASLRRAVGVVAQEAFLFSTSVRENIAFGRPEATDEEVTAAAIAAGADTFIRELPDGYATTVGERGLSLSGGQRQRIALARAIVAQPAVLVLDDATSAVDAGTEADIHAHLATVLAGRTTLIVAHRLSTIHLADRIALLDGGRLVATGTHEELISSDERYRRLVTDWERPADVGDSIDGLVAITAATAGRPPAVDVPAQLAPSPAAGLGPGLGRGGGGSWRAALAPTPELLARVDALPPVTDQVELDLASETASRGGFRLADLVQEFRRPLVIGGVLVVLDALAGLVGPALVRSGVDSGVLAGSRRALLIAAGVYLLVAVADLGVEVLETIVTGKTAERAMLALRIRIWAHLQRLGVDYVESTLSGRIMTRMTTDVDQFETLMESGVLSALVSLVTFVGVGIALLWMDLRLGLATLTILVPLIAVTMWFRRQSAVTYDQARERLSTLNAEFQESLSGIRETQAYAQESAAIEHFHATGRSYLVARIRAQWLVSTYFPFVQFLSVVAGAIVLGLGTRLIADGSLTAGALIAYLLYVELFFDPIQQLSQVFDAWQQTRVSVGRIDDLLATRPLVSDPDDPDALPSPAGALELVDVHFRYPDRQVGDGGRGPADRQAAATTARRRRPEAIRGISVRVEPGETVALVGQTGAGKSTIVKLLTRFYDVDDGSVRVGGIDVRHVPVAALRRRFGYVPQEGFLFTGTVRDNIAFGRPGASEDEIRLAAHHVGAHEVIEALPGGYDHQVGERGRLLSVGQRQLVALARAVLIDPDVLLLDEATASLDLATEAAVTSAMRRASGGRTTLLIAHRLPTAAAADRIVVIESGRVIEQGTHEELRDAGGRYAQLWEAFEHASAGGSPALS